ncbi:MAG: transposase [Vampirovibrio sp.]
MAKKGDCVGRAGKLKGTKLSLIANEASLPEAIYIEKGNRHDRHAFGHIMAEIPPNSCIVIDKGYDSKRLRWQ